MTQWKKPSKDYPFLEIPALQKGKTLDLSIIEIGLTEFKLPVSSSFITVWETPPKDISDPFELAKRLSIVGDTLCSLIKESRPYISVTLKDGPHDIVTNVDQGIEMIFRLWLTTHYPHHKIIGEEGYKDTITPDDYIWFIDPIDGTSNYVNGRDNVTFQVGCLYQGAPYAAYVGLPFLNKSYSVPTHKPYTKKPPIKEMVLGTEYLPTKKNQETIFYTLLSELEAESYQVKSIGINILGLLERKSTLFYKAKVKYWDAIPPMIVLAFLEPDLWEYSIIIPELTISPFSNNPTYITYLNKLHQRDSRIGLILITPKSTPEFTEKILQHFHDTYPHTRITR
jgi:fructose-1,6-bisphosphatase/inositol monophosphatase family enzyme